MRVLDISIFQTALHEMKDRNLFSVCKKHIHKNEALWEYNKLAIGAVGVFLQVTVAAAMIGTLGMAQGNLWIAWVGVFFAFMANSIVFMQSRVLWMISAVALSILVNTGITIFYLIALFN